MTFVPTSLEPVYLKTFTGAEYTKNQWLRPSYEEGFSSEKENYKEDYEVLTAWLEAKRLGVCCEENEDGGQCGKMQIRNVGADSNYLYLPYYTAEESEISCYVDHSVLHGRSPLNQSHTLTYYSYTQDFTELLEGENPNEIVELIQKYFYEQFQYTLNPGATPYDQDFTSYFLEVQKKGFCAHFATAGTLLCRTYGIPARYVEGYVIQSTDITGAETKEDEDTGEWFSGNSKLAKTGVVTVSVPDANAHAWTEIYIDGFGWGSSMRYCRIFTGEWLQDWRRGSGRILFPGFHRRCFRF